MSTLYEDLADLLLQTAGEEEINRDHMLPDIPNSNPNPIDYHTIAFSHFHRIELDFESNIVLCDQAVIQRLDMARLSDAGGDMVSSLASRGDLLRSRMRPISCCCASIHFRRTEIDGGGA